MNGQRLPLARRHLRLATGFAILLAAALLTWAAGEARAIPQAPTPSLFEAVEIHIDPGGRPLAAFQLEFVDEAGTARIAGIEGGEHPAFARPAYYDPAALARSRVILAAFSTDADLPAGRTRVATLHLITRQGVSPRYRIHLEVAADPEGQDLRPAAVVESIRRKA
ncbi:MAG: hypothetical protein JXQ29_03755 [Planctomycetes bacterium]|nr:hypothetical protein [Planctomycetota bacterium]